MNLLEAREILKKNGYSVRKLNECGGGSYRRPPKPSDDAEWISGCYGGHWHVPTEQDKRRRVYRDKRDNALADATAANDEIYSKAEKSMQRAKNKWYKAVFAECKDILDNYFESRLETVFGKAGWSVEKFDTISSYSTYLVYTFIAKKDNYQWKVSAEHEIEESSLPWRVICDSPSTQRIPRNAEKNSSYYVAEIKDILKKLNVELEEKLKTGTDGYGRDFDDEQWISKMTTARENNTKLMRDYDEEHGWDDWTGEFKDNLTPTGKLKKKIVRHESVELDRAIEILENTGYEL